MKKRQIIVNRKFQFNMAFSFAGITALFTAFMIIIISIFLVKNNLKLEEITKNQAVLSESEKEIFKTLVGFSNSDKIKNLHVSIKTLQRDNSHIKNLLNQNNEKISSITQMNILLIKLLIFISIVQTLFVFYIMIKRSHRISGPIFLLNRYINEIKNGNFPDVRLLRKNDDFHDLFDNFREMSEYLEYSNFKTISSNKNEKIK